MKKGFICALVLLLVAILTGLGGAQVSKPKIVSFICFDIGSAAYIQTAAVADAIMKKTNLRLRVIPGATDVGRVTAVRSGAVDFALTGLAGLFSFYGAHDFADPAWGPQDVQYVWRLLVPGVALVTAADANIKTPYDLKGKRVYWVPGQAGTNMNNTAFLAFANLTWNDVKKVELPSYAKALIAIKENLCDAGYATPTAPVLYDLASSPRGIYYPEFPESDKEGWARMTKVAPYFKPFKCTQGAGLSENNPRLMMAYGMSAWTYRSKDPDLVYQVVKAIHKTFDLYKKAHPMLPYWDIKYALDFIGDHYTYHEGAVRYFKEIGAWTAQHEAWQQKVQKRHQLLKEAWEDTIAEAADKKISAVNFPSFWEKMKESRQITLMDPIN